MSESLVYNVQGKEKGDSFLKSTLPRTASVERSRSWTMARLAMNSVAAVKYKFGVNMQSDTASFVLAISSGVETARLGNLNA